jgi:hypothetical protein
VLYTPLPADDAVPVHATAKVDLQPGEKGVIEVKPENDGRHQIPTVAISKYSGATYTIEVDGTKRFGPDAPTPPTDPDDLEATFVRCLELESTLTITVRDTRTTGNSREYEAHVVGYEEGSG